MCLARKREPIRGKLKAHEGLGQQKLPCNCVTNLLAPIIVPNKYQRELGLGAFSSSHPWWGWEALAPVSNKFPYCKLHCLEESSFPIGDSDYGQNTMEVRIFFNTYHFNSTATLVDLPMWAASLILKWTHFPLGETLNFSQGWVLTPGSHPKWHLSPYFTPSWNADLIENG